MSSGSLVALGAAAGTTDVDAITLTAANLVGDGLEVTPAARAVVAAVAVTSAVKAVIVGVVGESRRWERG